MAIMKQIICISLFLVFLAALARAEPRTNIVGEVKDPRGPSEITLCSQNMENFGLFKDVKAKMERFTPVLLKQKEDALISRFIEGECDVIAVQELLGKNEEVGTKILQGLAEKMRAKTNRIFSVRTGPSNDRLLRLGYLVADDRAEIVNMTSYWKVELPKLNPQQKPRFFTRGPLELQLEVNGRDGSKSKALSVVTFHFKSKAGKDDPAELEWETYRLEMAEALRRIVQERHAASFANGETLLVLLGDRNSNFDSASAQVLNGTLSLNHFQGDAPCRLSKKGAALCRTNQTLPQKLFSVLTSDPQTKLSHGTFVYKGIYSWLDEIAMPAETLRCAWKKYNQEGDYDSGTLSMPKEASDHAMVYVRLNW